MAGDWIKFEKATPDKPEVISMAASLRLSRHDVVGKLLCIWCWADTISIDGDAVPVPEKFLDELVQKKGFAKALRIAGWLGGEDYKLTFTNFERHNGTTAKARAESNRRMAKSRNSRNSGDGNVAVKAQQKAQPEIEIEREKKEPPVVPQGDGAEASRNAETRDRCLPEKWRNIPKGERNRISVLRNSPVMERIGKWFNRRPGTLWTLAEGIAFHEIKPSIDDIDLLESYYLAKIDVDRDHRRKNLITLLNNWRGEVDRAEGWKAENL